MTICVMAGFPTTHERLLFLTAPAHSCTSAHFHQSLTVSTASLLFSEMSILCLSDFLSYCY